MSDTIAAVATGQQLSAIGILRISGPGTLAAVDAVFRPLSGQAMSLRPARTLVLGRLLDRDGQTLDQCLCTVSRAPHSYTGEDTAELQCHGSPVVLRQGLEALFAAGVRQAGPGEFTRRAFLNGRMDLTQAEAVIDLIDAETAEAARNAAGQLGGAIARCTDGIYRRLLEILTHYQAEVDFPEEGVEPFVLQAHAQAVDEACDALRRLLSTFSRGQVLQSGLPAAIVGRPNAGKSSLMNALLGYERTIVTDLPGTTRDTISEKLRLGPLLLRLTDTAGLRATQDPVESIGVSRARDEARRAGLVLAVFDVSAPAAPEDEDAVREASAAPCAVAVLNKCDLPARFTLPRPEVFAAICRVSAKTGEGVDVLAQTVAGLFPAPEAPAGEILTNARQADAVGRALEAVEAAQQAMRQGLTPDAVLTSVEQALDALGELSGRTVRDDVVQRIFERFCVGK